MKDGKQHWDEVYRSKAADEVSWFQVTPRTSVRLVALAGQDRPFASVIDVGGGTSALVDALLETSPDVTVLDVSSEAPSGPEPTVSHRPRRGLKGDAGVVRVKQEVAPAAEAGTQPPPPSEQRCGGVLRSSVERVGRHAGNPSSTGSCPGRALVSAGADEVRRDRGSRRRP